MEKLIPKKMPLPAANRETAEWEKGKGNAFSVHKNITSSEVCQEATPALSPEASARLGLLAQRTGLDPLAIVEVLVRGADPQLVRACATLTPRLVGQGWRPRRFIPLVFAVVEDGQGVGDV